LAVKDLERTGAFDRKYLLVVTTTGSGWVDPALVDTFEYLSGGDSATVAMQYPYLPSWISYLVDQSKAREAGRALFDAVYGAWSQLLPDQRPKLLVAGESLGSFGGETAFSGHGHKYTSEYVDGWNAVMQPADITSQDLTDLRKIIAGEN
jgi:uncharacterized membrane protein